MAYCSSCGTELAAGASFCASCGAPSTMPYVPPPPSASPPPSYTPPAAAPGLGATPSWAAPPAPRVRPGGVTIVGVGIFVCAALVGFAMLGILFVAVFMDAFGAAMGDWDFGWFDMMEGWLSIVWIFGLLFLGATLALLIALGKGVLDGRSWAWAGTLVVAGLIALSSITDVFAGDFSAVIGLAAAGATLWYFFQPEVRAWFERPAAT